MGWRSSDTVLVFAAFTLPLITAAVALAAYNDWMVGDLNTIEIDYIFWAVVGVLASGYKTWLLGRDQKNIYRLRWDWRRQLGGMWTLAYSIGFNLIFSMWVLVGFVAGQLPSTPVYYSPVEGIPPIFLTGGLFILIQSVLLGITVFGLLCRRRLAE